MATKLQICNLALSWVGGDLIEDNGDPDPVATSEQVEAKICEANYDISLDQILSERTWTFATKYEVMDTPALTDPPMRYAKAFNLTDQSDGTSFLVNPVVFIHRVWSSSGNISNVFAPLEGSATNPPQPEWERVGDQIYADSSRIEVVYVAKVTDTTLYPTYFVSALATRIAADIAISLTENRQLQADLYTLYDQKITEAAAADGRQGRTERYDAKQLVGIRRY